MANFWRHLAFLALLCCSAGAPAQPAGNANDAERIVSFLSDIEVRRDASLRVTETIRIEARGEQFRHGLYRAFPTRYERGSQVVETGFEVESVTRNGRPEPWRTEAVDGGVRVWIGDANALLANGPHSYRLRYRTTGQIGFFGDYAELNWNVTGNDWPFTIDQAEARIRLPSPVRFASRSVFTGPAGSRAANAAIVAERPGDIRFRTTSPLRPGEGITVLVSWPKAVVRER
ncbi:MAG: hypothetical protein QOD42_2025 [Sphingomonadales bacterium]|jgi:hypothetical protein|nr:hypothetical protein [Sphingomonadales bacterium]